ncbi:MAG: PAS domain S-box protein [Roseiarcus sp.]
MLKQRPAGTIAGETPRGKAAIDEPVKLPRRREGKGPVAPASAQEPRPNQAPIKSGRDDSGDGGLLAALPIAVYRTDADGWIECFNPAAAQLWGRPPQAEGSRWCGAWRLYRPDGRAIAPEDSPTAIALRDGAPSRGIETLIERPDGTRVTVLNYPTPLRDASGRIVGAINALADVDDRNGAATEAQRLAAIVEGSEDAIISKGLDGVVTSWNPGATRIFGYTAQEMVGQPIARIVPLEAQEEEKRMLVRLAQGERIDHFDTVRVARDGRRIAISLTVSPLRDAAGHVVGASKVARDVTERKLAEETLRKATEEANQMRLDAERANRAKTDFLAMMSHEIRTPLNSISGFVDLLSNTTELTPKQRRYAGLVRAANAALLTIVNDILDFSKVEAGKLDLDNRPFSPAALIADTVEIVRPTAAANKLVLTCAVDPGVPVWVVGDHARLRQILLNLLNNAVKFTETGSIAVEAKPQTEADGRNRIRFSVADTGVGVTAEQKDRLFEKFSQADNSISRRHGGTGLGLAICKRLVALMEGEIGIDSEVGKGSTVWFTASMPPAPKPAPAPDVKAQPRNPASQKARILVIDDIDTNLEIVEAYLEDNGYLVDCVGSGLEAIQMLGGKPYDLILMDIQMPVMDGVAATKRIRALPPPIGDIPIIAMTGNVLPQQVRSFLDAGMNDHVGKPIERAKLYNNILRWLPRADAAKQRPSSHAPTFDRLRLEEFVLVVGAEKAERIADKFLVSLTDAFASNFVEARLEAHGLINTSGVFGLDRFVAACRRAMDIPPSDDAERERVALDELRRAQKAARHTLTTQIMPRLHGAALRPAV